MMERKEDKIDDFNVSDYKYSHKCTKCNKMMIGKHKTSFDQIMKAHKSVCEESQQQKMLGYV